MGLQAPEGMDQAEFDALSEEEQQALTADPDEIQSLKDAKSEIDAAAGDDDDDDKGAGKKGAGDGDDEEAKKAAAALKAAQDKAEADRLAAEKAQADADAAADDAEKAEAARVAKEAAEASAAAATAAKDKADADTKAREAAAATAGDDEDDEPFTPRYVAAPVEDFEGKMKALDTRQNDALAKFKEGDITIDDYNTERDAIEKERLDLRDKNLKAQIAQETEVQTQEQRWAYEINRFYRKVQREEGIDYGDSIKLNTALDTEVKRLANLKDNADKDGPWFLAEAHKAVKEKFGLKPAARTDDKGKAAAAAEAKRKADEDAARKARQPKRKDIPQDLGSAPNAGDDDGGASGGEFSHLEKLQGIELENALAKMPKEQADRYLAGA